MNFHKILLLSIFVLVLLCGCSKKITKDQIHVNLDEDSNISYKVDDVANADFLEDTGYQAYRIKYFMDEEFHGQDCLLLANKIGILIRDIDSDIFCGDIDGDGVKEMVFAATEGSGVRTLYLYVLEVKNGEIKISSKTGFGYEVTRDFSDFSISGCEIRKNEIDLAVGNKELKLVFDEKGGVKGEVDNKVVDVICVGQQQLDALLLSAQEMYKTMITIE